MSEPTNIQEAGQDIRNVGRTLLSIIILTIISLIGYILPISGYILPMGITAAQFILYMSAIISFILTFIMCLLLIEAGKRLEGKAPHDSPPKD